MARTAAKDNEKRKQTRRGESKHPGVEIIERKGDDGPRFYARWNDPKLSRRVPLLDDNGEPILDKRTGRVRTRMKRVRKEQCLDTLGQTSAKKRELWCKNKAKKLRAEIAAIKSGVEVVSQTSVSKTIEGYYKAKASELQPATLNAYRQGTKPFEAWCKTNAVIFIEELTPALLAQYREWFVGQKAYVPQTGNVGRGKRKVGNRKRSSAQANKCLNSLRVVLSQLRREGRLPELTRDDIVDSLKFVRRDRAKRSFLNAAQTKSLLEAAVEHDGSGHWPIAPFAAACLLTGMRFHELADLTWSEVDTDAEEILLAAQRTKTSVERAVRLDVMPTLLKWLKDRRPSSGKGRVFPRLTFAVARKARARLIDQYDAPEFTWHRLRATCGTYSVCSSLYGRGSEHETARQLGHSIQVAQSHYTGRAKDCRKDAETLEEALGCEGVFSNVFSISNAAQPVDPAQSES